MTILPIDVRAQKHEVTFFGFVHLRYEIGQP
jgi:hypothetical protein